ncbi:MAG: chromosome segregation protein SMC, partial [Lachnospiraceae bacterium]|nr:chromosome segregation protein SMC [Lachnospiraceae bacterium]
MLEQIAIRKAELNSRLLRVKSDEAAREDSIRQLEQQFEEITQTLAAMNKQTESMEKELVGLRETLAKKDAALREAQEQYHQEKSRLDALANLTERYEGYGGSVKRVMEQKDTEKGIIGVVADIIKVEKRFETAIETALGGNIQNIVTDDEETAKRMIGFLKKNKLGRATFLPLTSITNPQEFKNPDALAEKGVIGMADGLVNTEERYRNVARAMLGRIMVVDNIDNAVKIARKFDYGIRMVTLEGELLGPGGAISGGAFKNNSNLLGRRREIEELEKKTEKLLASVKTFGKEIEDTKEKRNKLRLEIEAHKAEIQRKFLEQNTVRLNVEAAKEKMEEAEAGSRSLRNEEEEVEKQILDIKSSKEEIRRELEESEKQEKSAEEQIADCQKELEERRGEETESAAKVSEWDMKVERMLQTQGFLQQNVDRISGEIKRFEAELAEIEGGLSDNVRNVEEKTKNITEIEKTIAASHTTQEQSKQELSDNIARKEELSAKQKNFFTERETLAEQMTSLDKEVYRLNAQKEKFEEAMENQINYMWDEYEITLSDAASIRNEEMTDLSAMKREITSLKEQIKKLGDVNVNAIEDYKNLMERYTFLKNQHDDLVEAEKTLEGIITELDTAMRKQFHEKFGEINREFDKVFKELFGGGKGSLELMEDEDILEAGIRIIAQTPGKKLQNMMQLSGGEKALTAISLLFA